MLMMQHLMIHFLMIHFGRTYTLGSELEAVVLISTPTFAVIYGACWVLPWTASTGCNGQATTTCRFQLP